MGAGVAVTGRTAGRGGVVGAASAAREWAAAVADWGRLPGVFSSSWAITSANASGSTSSRGGASFSTRRMCSPAVSPIRAASGGLPLIAACRTAPRAYKSDAVLTVPSRSVSGATYN
ncbi:hypothetical protein GCM10009804_73860 [Kribbella hippodromi]|uniref:Uncharacterized protein n=1 Tax=Kribbella hippodromi TaxID=434347 RepID=A0ABP4QEH1_9ACTN